jgi:hypothetical protein
MFPVAMRELQFHVWEHMKHRYESVKRAAIMSSKGQTHAPADLDMIEAIQSLQPSSRNADDAPAARLDRIQRIEGGQVLACQTAIDRSEQSSHRSMLGEIAENHLSAVELLRDFCTSTAERPTARPRPSRGPWARVVWSATLGETSLLKAVAANERKSGRLYSQMLSEDGLPRSARGLIEILSRKAEEHAQTVGTATGSRD